MASRVALADHLLIHELEVIVDVPEERDQPITHLRTCATLERLQQLHVDRAVAFVRSPFADHAAAWPPPGL